MGIIRIAEIGPREADLQLQRVTRNYTRVFLVETDSAAVGGLEVMLADLGGGQYIPRYGDFFQLENEYDGGAIVTRVTPKQDPECPKVWTVTVNYESLSADPVAQQGGTVFGGGGGGGGGGGSPEDPTASNPLYQPPQWSWGSQEFVEVMEETAEEEVVDRKTIRNSAKDPFDPAPTRERSYLTLTITRNEWIYQYRPYWAHEYENTVNKGTWQLQPAGTWLLRQISAGSQTWQDRVLYYQVRYFFIFRKQGWDVRLLDQGSHYLEGGERKRFTSPTGLGGVVHLLNGAGAKLPDGNLPVYLPFKKYPDADFNALDLPPVAIL